MKIWKWILAVLLCGVLILGILFGPGIYRGVKMFSMICDVWNQPEASLDLRVDERMNIRLDWTELPQGRVLILESSGVKVCFCSGVIYLENGKGFDFTQSTRNIVTMLQDPWKLLPLVTIQQEKQRWTVSMAQPDVRLTLEEGASGIAVAQVRFSDTVMEITPQTGRPVLAVPEQVAHSISQGTVPGNGDLTEALLRLLGAWAELGSRDILAMDVKLSADCGPLSLAETLNARMDQNLGIGYVEKAGRGLYFKDGKICTADGKLLAQAETDVEAAQLLGVAYLLLLNGDFTCQGNVYTLELDQQGMADFAYTILPAAEKLNIGFESGRIQLVLEEHTLDRISVSCTGTLDLILTTVQASIGTELQMKEATIFSINQAVLDALNP